MGPTGSGKSTLTNLTLRLVDPDRGDVTLDGTDLRAGRARRGLVGRGARAAADVHVRRHRARQHHPRRSTTPTSRSGPRSRSPRPTGSSRPSPPASTPGWGSAARPSPVASASGSPWPGPSSAPAAARPRRRDERRRPGRGAGDPRRPAPVQRRHHRARGRLPHVDDHPRRRDRLRRAAAAWSTTARTRELQARCAGYERLVTAYAREAAERAAVAADEEVDRVDVDSSRRWTPMSTSIDATSGSARRRRCAAGSTCHPSCAAASASRWPSPPSRPSAGSSCRSWSRRPPTTACSARTVPTPAWSPRYVLFALIAVAATAVDRVCRQRAPLPRVRGGPGVVAAAGPSATSTTCRC